MDATRAASRIGRLLEQQVGPLRRYGQGGRQGLLDQLRGDRHVMAFAVRELHHPRRLAAAFGAYRDALARQDALFVRQQVDDVTDAMRHAGASALIVDRVARRGSSLDVAADFMRRLGRAHERDSQLTGAHRAASELMDLHNNELGITIALEHARAGRSSAATEAALEGAVLRAIAQGRALVLDAPTAPPRASTADELASLLRDPDAVLRA